MSTILKAKRKVEREGKKTLWIDVGFTVFLGEYQGRPSYQLVDERTGEKYSLFDVQRDNNNDRQHGGGQAQQQSYPDDVPF